MTPRAKNAAKIAAGALVAMGHTRATADLVWKHGKDGVKPAVRIGTWRILATEHNMSLTQIAYEASPVNPKTGKRFHHTTILSGLRRYNDYFGEGRA